MSEKKSFWEKLFSGGGCSCGMSLEEEEPAPKKKVKKGGCCDMQILEDDDNEENLEHKKGK